jgi:hypothetical protein
MTSAPFLVVSCVLCISWLSSEVDAKSAIDLESDIQPVGEYRFCGTGVG